MDLKIAHKQPDPLADDLSDVASSRSEEESLSDADLPSYQDDKPGPSSHAAAAAATAPEKQPLSPGTTASQPRPSLGPTTSQPFNFPPASDLPPYPSADAIQKPLAVPQVFAAPNASFIPAYPTLLLQHGIPRETWLSFLSTLSAFLSAKVSQQTLHHASDVANSIADFHKDYAARMRMGGKQIGRSARSFNPFGVVGAAIGMTFQSVGHVVGSVMMLPRSVLQRPRTPLERAAVYLVAANRDWFQPRGLRAVLLTMDELAGLSRVAPQEMLAVAQNGEENRDASAQMSSLERWIGSVEVKGEEEEEEEDEKEKKKEEKKKEDPSVSSTSSLKAASSSGEAGKRASTTARLQLTMQTIWLVIVPVTDAGGTDFVPGQALNG